MQLPNNVQAMSLQQEAASLFAVVIDAKHPCDHGEVAQLDGSAGFLGARNRYCKCSLAGHDIFGCTALTLPRGHPAHGKQVVWCVRDLFYNLEHGVTELHVWIRSLRIRTFV